MSYKVAELKNLKLYADETFQHDLLTEREEFELADSIERAKTAFDLLQSGKLTLAQYNKIQETARLARDQLIRANLRWVVTVAKRFLRQAIILGSSIDDLVFEGNLGLIQAAERFKSDRGTRFSTYAIFYIKQAIMTHLSQQHILSAPSYIRDLAPLMLKAKSTLTRRGEEVNAENLAKEMEISQAKAAALLQLTRASVSLEWDHPNTDHRSDNNRGLEDPRAENPSEVVGRHIDEQIQMERLSELSPREALVLRLYYGVETGSRMTLREVGERIGLTRERVRQIKHEAIEKLQVAFPDD